MRSIFLCTALCVASPTYAISPEYFPEAIPLAGSASAPTVGVTPPTSADPVVSPILAAHAEHPLVQPRLEEIEPEPNENSLLNASGRDERKLTKTELCSAAASVAAANNLPIPFFANLNSTRKRLQTPSGQPSWGAGYCTVIRGSRLLWPPNPLSRFHL